MLATARAFKPPIKSFSAFAFDHFAKRANDRRAQADFLVVPSPCVVCHPSLTSTSSARLVGAESKDGGAGSDLPLPKIPKTQKMFFVNDEILMETIILF